MLLGHVFDIMTESDFHYVLVICHNVYSAESRVMFDTNKHKRLLEAGDGGMDTSDHYSFII